MKISNVVVRSSIVAAVLALPLLAGAQVKIGVIYSATGPTALVGIPQRNTVALLPPKIGDYTVEYIGLDDASDPTTTVTNAKKLLTDHKVDAIVGPSGSPNAMALLDFVAEAKTPMLAPVGTAAVVLPMTEQKKWVFKTTQNDDIIAAALFGHMGKAGVKTLGLIGTADPYGENWAKVAAGLAEKQGIRIVANEKFQRSDSSVTGQNLRLIGAKPDAILVAAPGGAAVLPQLGLSDAGYPGQVYQTHGAALPDYLKLGGKKIEGTILAASGMLVLDEIPDSNASKKVARGYVDAYKAKYGQVPATFGANVYDAGLLLQQAVPIAAKAGQPGSEAFRVALRDALEQTREMVGTQGVYNMSAADHSGFDARGRELIVVKDGGWKLLESAKK